jgi:hypothetical protein
VRPVFSTAGHQRWKFIRPTVRVTTQLIPAFSTAVVIIVSNGSQEQVAWVYTGRSVTAMEHTETGRNAAMLNCPYNAGCNKEFPNLKAAVALGCSGGCPVPAFVGTGLADFFPKTFNVLRSQRRDSTIRSMHGDLLTGRCARTVRGQPASRSLLWGSVPAKAA